MEYANLSVEEIQRQIEETQSKNAELQRVLKKRKKEGCGDIATQVKELIVSSGYTVDEILPYLTRGYRGHKAGKNKAERRSRYYFDPRDPENRTYVRGVLPGWMKQMMVENGYDPSSKEDRQTFKNTCLELHDDS